MLPLYLSQRFECKGWCCLFNVVNHLLIHRSGLGGHGISTISISQKWTGDILNLRGLKKENKYLLVKISLALKFGELVVQISIRRCQRH